MKLPRAKGTSDERATPSNCVDIINICKFIVYVCV